MNEKFFRAVAVAAANLWGIPLLLAADGAGFGVHEPLRLVGCLLFGIILYVCGYFAAGLSGRLKKAAAANLIYYGGGIAVAAGSIVYSVSVAANSLYLPLFLAYAVWNYYGGGRLGRRKEPINPVWLAVYCFIALICYLVYGLFAAEPSKSFGEGAIVVVTVLMLICGANVLNQREITNQSSRRSNIRLPKNFRRFNSGLVTVFLSVILLLYLFRDIIGAGLWWLFRTIFLGIVNMLSGFSNVGTEVDFGEPHVDGITPYEGADRSGLWTLLAVAVIIVICIVFRRYIVNFFRAIADLLRARLSRRPQEKEEEGAYTDYFEWETVRRSKTKRPYRAALREYRKEREPQAKYRLGYKVFLCWLEMKGVVIAPSDTVEKQLAKSTVVSDEIGEKYRSLRYNDEAVGDRELKEMDSFLKLLGSNR